jgi:hypothetical protein
MAIIAPDTPGDSGQSLASNLPAESTRANVVQVGEAFLRPRPKVDNYCQRSVDSLFQDGRIVLTFGSRLLRPQQVTEDGYFVSWLNDSLQAKFDSTYCLGWSIWSSNQDWPMDLGEKALRGIGDAIVVVRSYSSQDRLMVTSSGTSPAFGWRRDDSLKVGDDLAQPIQEAAREQNLKVVGIQVTGLDNNHPLRAHCVLIAILDKPGASIRCLFVGLEAEPVGGRRPGATAIFDHFLALAPALIRDMEPYNVGVLPKEPPPISAASDPRSLVEQWQAHYGEKVSLPGCNTLDSLGIQYKNIRVGANYSDFEFTASNAAEYLGIPFKVSWGQIHSFCALLSERIFCGQANGESPLLQDLFLTPENLEELGKLLGIPKATWYEIACRIWKDEGTSASFEGLLLFMDQGTPFVEIHFDSGYDK